MAVGARPAEILRMILGQGMALALVGVGLGLFGALWLTRLLQELLFEVTPTGPVTYAGVATTLGLAALVACYVPARRAARVAPTVALLVAESGTETTRRGQAGSAGRPWLPAHARGA